MCLNIGDLIEVTETFNFSEVKIIIIDEDLAREKEINRVRFKEEENVIYIDVSDGM